MNNIIKTGFLTLVFTVIPIGFFAISTTPMVDYVFAENENSKGNNNNFNENIAISDSSNDTTEKCTPWDPRGC